MNLLSGMMGSEYNVPLYKRGQNIGGKNQRHFPSLHSGLLRIVRVFSLFSADNSILPSHSSCICFIIVLGDLHYTVYLSHFRTTSFCRPNCAKDDSDSRSQQSRGLGPLEHGSRVQISFVVWMSTVFWFAMGHSRSWVL
jgi:hypothetical protein